MADVTWNYVADGLAETGEVLVAALLAAIDSPVIVAPLDDDISDKFGVWLRGDQQEVDAVREILEADLDKRHVGWNGLEWVQPLESGK